MLTKIVHRVLKSRLRPHPMNVYDISRGTSMTFVPKTTFDFFKVARQRNFSDEVTKSRSASAGESTIFDKIILKEIKADIIYEDDKCLAFNDISPQAPVHFLVIPKKRIAMLDSCQADDSEVLGHLVLTAKSLAQKRLPDGYRLVINNGRHGAQSVYHLHIHILGGRQLSWPPG